MRTFPDIDALRRKHKLTRKAVYDLAGVNGETWRRLARGSNQPVLRTLEKLNTALDALIAEKAQAKVNCEPEGGLSQSQLQERRA